MVSVLDVLRSNIAVKKLLQTLVITTYLTFTIFADMNSYKVFGLILLFVNGLPAQTMCYDGYCYSSDGVPKVVGSLKDAQDYCYNNDSSSWLLEIYSPDQLLKIMPTYLTDPSNEYLLNMVGIPTTDWTSVLEDPFPSRMNIFNKITFDIILV